MVDEAKLTGLLSELAHTLTADFPVQRVLDQLAERIAGVLPVAAVGLTILADGAGASLVAASDAAALRFEILQAGLGEGPGIAARMSGASVLVDDLLRDGRYPRFRSAAIAAGVGAVFAFPIGHGSRRLGALDLYRQAPGSLDPVDIDAAQTLADVAAAYHLDARSRAEAVATAERVRSEVLHDPLTGLPNRLLFEERAAHAARRATRSHTDTAILFAAVDGFERVNHEHGHKIGDALLVAVASRLSALLRPGDTLARLSGDEFAFMCEDLRNPADVETLAKRIENAFDAPFWFEGIELAVTASIGMAFSGPGEGLSDELLIEAGAAMHRARGTAAGSSQTIIDLRSTVPTDDPFDLERDLRLAFLRGELEMAYQPVVSSRDGLVVGVEALLRWTHAERGEVSPIAMVEVAERGGLIHEIGIWALERSCADHATWRQRHPQLPLELAVNVSARQLMRPGFGDAVAGVLVRTGMDPRALILEVTENVLIEEDDGVIDALFGLRDRGIRLAIDDFGTGYSSLSQLRRLPVDIVKIDRSFIEELGGPTVGGRSARTGPHGGGPGRGRDDTAREVVAAVTRLAHELGLEVTAEGVETRFQRDEIVAVGCESAQGYFFARPMSADGIDGMLQVRGVGRLRLPTAEVASTVG